MGGPVFKVRNDPRVTRLGRTLRTSSIDELPQLFNVLLGQMSLVGPRPLPRAEQEQIQGWHRRRLSMKPGITGLWQVSGRSSVAFDQWMKLDLEYVDNWSLKEDGRLLLRTIPALLQRRGAH
jgi:lipopolysaccharide/colanic/teichoic acid biosynthesis glycosyltransferase